MPKLLPFLIVFGVFLGSAEEIITLPEWTGGPEDFTSITASWTDCFGAYTHANGTKYLSGYKDGKRHVQSTV